MKEAAKLLAGLPLENRKKVIELIRTKDSVMADDLLKNIVTLEDLKYLTVSMMVDLLKEIKPTDLALALKLASDEVKNHIKTLVTKRIWEEISEILITPKPKSEVLKSHDKLMEIILKMSESGKVVLSKSSDEYV